MVRARTRSLAVSTLLAAATMPATRPLAAQLPDSTVGRRRIQLLPALGSAPETGIQYGATLFGVFGRAPVLRTRPAALMAYALRTAKSQTRIGVEDEHWSTGNARRIGGSLVWQEYPLPFYGIGDDAPESAKELFTPRGIEGLISVQQRVPALHRKVYALSSLRVVSQTIRPDTVGTLRDDAITGSRGGRIVELTAGALADTRDNLFAPARGGLVTLSYGRSASALGSDFTYGRLRLDARAYRGLGTDASRGVVAAQLLATGIDGNAPFDQLALVGGGDIMRGYARGRYRDQWFAGAQAEYRTPMRNRLGAVLFGGAGTVARSAGSLGSGRLLPTYGAGLRVGMDAAQRTSVRVDYGRGRDGSGLYIGFNQAF